MLFLYLIPYSWCLRISELRIPDLVDVRDNATMFCKFDLDGDNLYSVKWYKEDWEFFRYMPNDVPQIRTFKVKGVYLQEKNSNLTSITLGPLEFSSTGTYRCEVSTEAPHFKTVFQHSNMTVLGLPKEDPYIYGIKPTYAIGDYVTANCTSSPSNPPASLEWLINGVKADDWYLVRHKPPKSMHHLGLQSSSIGLKFQVDNSHFPNTREILRLTCTAKVEGVTRRRTVLSNLAKLTNEKYAQEKYLNSGERIRPVINLFLLIFWIFTTT